MLTTKRLASLREGYTSLYYGLRNMPALMKALKKETISKHFNTRIMLAVTEVNGCAFCSYGHTTLALESGMTAIEIDQLLGGETGRIPQEEQAGILFAQHVADNRGKSSQKVWERLVVIYGEEVATGILASTQVIMMGNAFGIPVGSLFSRVSKRRIFKKDERTTLRYEWAMLIGGILFLPVALIHSILFSLVRRPKVKIEE